MAQNRYYSIFDFRLPIADCPSVDGFRIADYRLPTEGIFRQLTDCRLLIERAELRLPRKHSKGSFSYQLL